MKSFLIAVLMVVLFFPIASANQNGAKKWRTDGAQVSFLAPPLSTARIQNEDGFELYSSSESSNISIQGNVRHFSLEMALPTSDSQQELSFFGSSLGTVRTATTTITAKWYPLIDGPILPYAGIGVQHDERSGNFAMGGISFPRSGEKIMYTIWQVGSEFNFTGNLFVVVDYKSGGTGYDVYTPDGGPILHVTSDPTTALGIGWRF